MADGIGAASASAAPVGMSLAAGSPAPAGGPDGELQAIAGQVRTIGQQVTQLQGQYPQLAEGCEQILQVLKQLIVTAASQQQTQQTASGLAVPGAGGS